MIREVELVKSVWIHIIKVCVEKYKPKGAFLITYYYYYGYQDVAKTGSQIQLHVYNEETTL